MQQGKDKLQVRLDSFYGPQDGLSFSGKMWAVDVIMKAVDSDHRPILTTISFGQTPNDLTCLKFKLKASHLVPDDFMALVHRV